MNSCKNMVKHFLSYSFGANFQTDNRHLSVLFIFKSLSMGNKFLFEFQWNSVLFLRLSSLAEILNRRHFEIFFFLIFPRYRI